MQFDIIVVGSMGKRRCNMSNWNHFTLEERIRIASCLAHGKSAVEIAEELGKSPTSISREIKRSRFISSKHNTSILCPKLQRYPHVCNGCSRRYDTCGYTKYKYSAKKSELQYITIKNTTRNHVIFSESELSILAEHIRKSCESGLSVHQAILTFKSFPISEPTVYSLLKKGLLKGLNKSLIQKNKRRKKKDTSYIYKDSIAIDRCNHTYLDFLKHTFNKNISICEMDFLGKSPGDPIDILTLCFRDINYIMLFSLKNKNSSKVAGIFNYLQELIGMELFQILFEVILTDREPSFSDFNSIGIDVETGEIRSNVFYCDPYRSSQKALVENRNKQLRRYINRGDDTSKLEDADLKLIEDSINSLVSKSLDRRSAKDAFIAVHGVELYKKITDRKYCF